MISLCGKGANSLDDLFNAVDQMKFEYIAGFDDMAAGHVPGQPLEQQEIHKRLGGDRKLEEDFSNDLIKLANASNGHNLTFYFLIIIRTF